MNEIENKKGSWKEFWEIIITLLGTYFAAYTISKDYGDMVILGRMPHNEFIGLLKFSIIIWFIFMAMLIVLAYIGFKIMRWISTNKEHR